MAERYEYILRCGRLGLSEERGRAFQAELNDLGAEGWRAVGMSGDTLSASVLLERPIPSADDRGNQGHLGSEPHDVVSHV